MSLVLLVGGARSGKSQLALRLAARQAAPVVFVATAEARDGEMAARIEQHRRERPGSWQTCEEPLYIKEALESIAADDCVVLDCLTLWAANALEQLDAGEVEAQAAAAAQVASSRQGLTIVVTNEVGLGVVPANHVGRAYRDLLGRVNAIWAEAADRVFLLIAGRALEIERADALVERLS